jgi:hypothetical protein
MKDLKGGILINNAGIENTMAFARMEEEEVVQKRFGVDDFLKRRAAGAEAACERELETKWR